ncbi:hypothetical protein UY3_05500 [Chelonia mydas]|uniref:Uncharacterized protein n=1 Tax=Chelonia mydas TaxID=8469 RepID=M7BHG5_CHEMY|nr:hypothetical protein UY3_05500 [Chelonia mydas]
MASGQRALVGIQMTEPKVKAESESGIRAEGQNQSQIPNARAKGRDSVGARGIGKMCHQAKGKHMKPAAFEGKI